MRPETSGRRPNMEGIHSSHTFNNASLQISLNTSGFETVLRTDALKLFVKERVAVDGFDAGVQFCSWN